MTSRNRDSHDKIPSCIVNTVVVLVDVYGESSLTWLPGVCNHDLPNSLLAFVERSIFPGLVAVPCAVREL